MTALYRGRDSGPERSQPGDRGDAEVRPQQPERTPDQVLEHFDFEHPVFTHAEPNLDRSLPESLKSRLEYLAVSVSRQIGVAEVIAVLRGAPTEGWGTEANEYVQERLASGAGREELLAEVEAVHEALEHRIEEFADRNKNS